MGYGKTVRFIGLDFSNSSTSMSVFFIGACVTLFQTQLIDIVLLWCCCGLTFGLGLIYRKFRFLLFTVGIALFGLCWTTYSFQHQQNNVLPKELELVDLSVVGSIEGLPVVKGENVKFVLRLESSDNPNLKHDTRLKLSCYRCGFRFAPDERWQLTLRLKQPHGYASWGAFDYEKYLFRHQIIAQGYVRNNNNNKRLDRNNWSVDQLRWSISNTLKSHKSIESTALAMILALGIGDKSLMSQEQRQVFQDSGVSHLMAISGLHVGLVFLALRWVCIWLSYPFAKLYIVIPRQRLILIPALAGAFLYAALAGFSISTVRALVMLFIFVLCRLTDRDVSLHKVLLATVCVIVLLDPLSILDVGFWLSCGAVYIIGSVGDKASSLLRLQPLLWLGMLPLSALFFGQVSLISLVVNLVAVPLFCLIFIPLTLVSLSLLAFGFDLIAWYSLKLLSVAFTFIFDFLKWLAAFEFSIAYTVQWSYWHTVLFVIALILFRFKAVFISSLFWLVLSISLFFPINKLLLLKQETQLIVSLLDVGQGLSMVVQVKGLDDYTLVYDTGPSYPSGFSAAKAVVVPFLRSQGVTGIDRLIISHADNDHIGGYDDLTKAMPVTDVLSSNTTVLSDAQRCSAGQSWSVGEVTFDIISPDDKTPDGSNNLSCVLRISYGENKILITGDIEASVERRLINVNANQNHLKANILLAPHHGSKTSSSVAFIDAVQPEIALISAGYLNRYNHPHPDVVARYVKKNIDLLTTVDSGSVKININPAGWSHVLFRDVNSAFWHNQKKPN